MRLRLRFRRLGLAILPTASVLFWQEMIEPKAPIGFARLKLGSFCQDEISSLGPRLRCPSIGCASKPCGSAAVQGKKRCRMHGGAAGSGVPRGNRKARKHGLYTREAIAQRRQLGELMRQSQTDPGD
jgi:hypothetical protein